MYRGSVEATLPGEKERAKKIYDVGGNCPLEPESQRTLLTWLYLTLTGVIGEQSHSVILLNSRLSPSADVFCVFTSLCFISDCFGAAST